MSLSGLFTSGVNNGADASVSVPLTVSTLLFVTSRTASSHRIVFGGSNLASYPKPCSPGIKSSYL